VEIFFLESAGELRINILIRGKNPKWYSLGLVPNPYKGYFGSVKTLSASMPY